MLIIAFIVIIVISIGQNAEQNKRMNVYNEAYGYSRNGKPADVQTLEMRNRVREEWKRMGNDLYNCLGETWFTPGGNRNIKKRNWFRRHLEAQGIPYDDFVLDEVSGVAHDRAMRKLNEYDKYHRRGWF